VYFYFAIAELSAVLAEQFFPANARRVLLQADSNNNNNNEEFSGIVDEAELQKVVSSKQ